MSSILRVLRKLAEDLEPTKVEHKDQTKRSPQDYSIDKSVQPTKIEGQNNKKNLDFQLKDMLLPTKVEKIKNEVKDEKWYDKYNNVDPLLIKEYYRLNGLKEEISNLPMDQKILRMRELHSIKKQMQEISQKLTLTSYDSDSGNILWSQSPKQEHFEEGLLEQAGVKYPKYINRGVYSKVYLGVYENKPVVAKLTRSSKDVETANEVISLKASLPQIYSKHLLNIYNVLSVKDQDDEKYFVIITERLNHVNTHVRDLLENIDLSEENHTLAESTKSKKDSLKILLKQDDDVIKKIIHDIIRPVLLDGNVKKFDFLVPWFKKSIAVFIENKKNILDVKISLIELISSTDDTIPDSIVKGVVNNMIDALLQMQKSIQLPLSTRVEQENIFPTMQKLPEVKSFVNFLLFLKKIGWVAFDLSRKNIMERQDHTLVLSDIGTIKKS